MDDKENSFVDAKDANTEAAADLIMEQDSLPKINEMPDLDDVLSTEDEDLVEIEDELYVEDSIEDDEHVPEAGIPVADELNWEDLEVVDEIDSTEISNPLEVDEHNEWELQKISDDEDDSIERPTNKVSFIPEKKLSDENALSVEVSGSKEGDFYKTETTPAIEHVDGLSVENVNKAQSNSLNIVVGDEIRQIDDDLENLTPVSAENECQIVDSFEPDSQNITSIESDDDIDDVLEIAVREELELNEPDTLIVESETKAVITAPSTSVVNDSAIDSVVETMESKPEIRIIDEVPKSIAQSSSELSAKPKRTEPLPAVALYIDSLAQLSFDWKKYTCFYCVPCQFFVTTTSLFEDHIGSMAHKENNFRWKTANDLLQRKSVNRISTHQPEIEKCSEFIVAVEYVMEICDDSYQPRHWYCRLCNCVINSFDLLLAHLNVFSHIDNYIEKRFPNIYLPPGPNENDNLSCNIRTCSESEEKRIVGFAKKNLKRILAKLNSYKGASLTDMNEEDVQAEEDLLASQIHQFFNDGKDYNVKSEFCSSSVSVANSEYKRMTEKKKNSLIGLQYLLEIWAPSRRVAPVWYCMLCDSLVSNWSQHCEVVQHIAAYLKKHYEKYAFDCSVLEANDEEELRNNFSIAKANVLQLEGYGSRVNNVIQVKRMDDFDSFVAINAIIAKHMVNKYKIKVGEPPRAKRPSTSQDSKNRSKQATSGLHKPPPSKQISVGKSPSKPAVNSKSPSQSQGNRILNSVRQSASSSSPKMSVKPVVDSSPRTNGKAPSAISKSKANSVANPKCITKPAATSPPKAQPMKVATQTKTSTTQKKFVAPAAVKTNLTTSKNVTSGTKVNTTLKKVTTPVQQKNTPKSDSAKAAATEKPTTPTTTTTTTQVQDESKVSKQVSSANTDRSKQADAHSRQTVVNVSKKPTSSITDLKSGGIDKSNRRSPKRRGSRSPSYSPKRRRSEDEKSSRRHYEDRSHRTDTEHQNRHLPIRRYSPQRNKYSPSRPIYNTNNRIRTASMRSNRSPSPRYAQITPRIRVPIRRSPSPPPPPPPTHSTSRRHERSRTPGTTSNYDDRRNRRDDYRRPTPEVIDYQHQQQKYDLTNDVLSAVLQSTSTVTRGAGSLIEQPIVYLSDDNLAKFTELLRVVGFDIGRRITLDDLDGLRERFGSVMFDQFLNMVLTQPLGVVQQQQPQPSIIPDLLSLNLISGAQAAQQRAPHPLAVGATQEPAPSTNQRRPPSNVNYYGNSSLNKKRGGNRTPSKQPGSHVSSSRQYSIQQRIADASSHQHQQKQHQQAAPQVVDYFGGQNLGSLGNANLSNLNLSVPPPPIPLQQTSSQNQQQQQQSLVGFLNATNLFGNSASSLTSSASQQPLYGQHLFDAAQTSGNFWPTNVPRGW